MVATLSVIAATSCTWDAITLRDDTRAAPLLTEPQRRDALVGDASQARRSGRALIGQFVTCSNAYSTARA